MHNDAADKAGNSENLSQTNKYMRVENSFSVTNLKAQTMP